MSWHEATLRLEVALEFQRNSPRQWEATEAGLWSRRARAFAAWHDYGRWWSKTAMGRAAQAKYDLGRRVEKLKKWAEFGLLWQKTEAGKAYARKKQAARYSAKRTRGECGYGGCHAIAPIGSSRCVGHRKK